MPPPDSPMTSMAAISSWAFFMLACSAIACFIMFPPPRITVSWSFSGSHRLRVQCRAETRLHFPNRGIFLERAPRRIKSLGRTPLAVLAGSLRRQRAFHEFDLHGRAEILAERLHQAVLVGGRVERGALRIESEAHDVAAVRHQCAVARELTRGATHVEIA